MRAFATARVVAALLFGALIGSVIGVGVGDASAGGAVTLVSPKGGKTISGIATIVLNLGSKTGWCNLYLDGVYRGSTPPDSLKWDTTAVSNGAHVLMAAAFDRGGKKIGTSFSKVKVANGSAPPPPPGGGGGSGSSAVSISSPSNGDNVSGSVNVTVAPGSGVSWINTYIDGSYLSSTPPTTYSWDSTSVNNGSHTISAKAFDSSGALAGSASASVNVSNTGSTGVSHFDTQPPGSSLPSGATCASEVRRNPNFEPRPDNNPANHTTPSDDLSNMRTTSNNGGAPSGAFDRVDGNFTGTTDEILQWGACKWGFDEDLVRAIAANETWWRQPAHGDFTTNTSLCPSGANYHDGGCDLTYGILQIKSTDFSGTFPDSQNSTAFTVDYKLAYQRACFEGRIGYLSNRSSDYPSSDQNDMLWGCVDQWYTGTWWNGSDDKYLSETRSELAQKPWLRSDF
jgi:hypothetical protein